MGRPDRVFGFLSVALARSALARSSESVPGAPSVGPRVTPPYGTPYPVLGESNLQCAPRARKSGQPDQRSVHVEDFNTHPRYVRERTDLGAASSYTCSE
jgi:hypothetical protein